jgi:fructose-1,6-bisphosphatase/inositol monophosphatase family enzyme
MNTYLRACVEGVKAGGDAISGYRPKTLENKGDTPLASKHVIVTDADYKSGHAAISTILGIDPNAIIMTEEHGKAYSGLHDRLFMSGDSRRLENFCGYIIDELDGSSPFEKGHHEWSVSIGYVDKLVHRAGAVYAPKINGGTLFYASIGKGAFVQSHGETKRAQVSKCSNLKDAYVIFGPDCFLENYPIHNRLVLDIANRVRTVNSCGSSALGLGLVSAGRADAIIQPLHSPWDWAAGKSLVEEAGGRIIFYEMNNGIRRVDKLEPKHYDPNTRRVGFIAGNDAIAESTMKKLLKLSRC